MKSTNWINSIRENGGSKMSQKCDFTVGNTGIEGNIMLSDREKVLWDLSMQGLLTVEILNESRVKDREIKKGKFKVIKGTNETEVK